MTDQTDPTPEYLRALAEAASNLTVDNDWDATVIANVMAALRAAADQLEAVQTLYSQDWQDIDDERWEDQWNRGHMSALRDVRAILTAETAP